MPNGYDGQSDLTQSTYVYFFSLVSHSDYSSKIINELKKGHKPFSKVEIKNKCLLWLSAPIFKRKFSCFILEGFIERKNSIYWERCKLMLQDMFRDNSKENDSADKLIFNIKEINQIPVFSHFYDRYKTITESMIRNEFIKHYVITSIEELISPDKKKDTNSKSNKIHHIDHSNYKVFTSFYENSIVSSQIRERWNSKYSELRDTYHVTEDITRNQNKKPKETQHAKVKTNLMIMQEVPEYILNSLENVILINSSTNFYRKARQTYQKSLGAKTYAEKYKLVEHTAKQIHRDKNDDSKEVIPSSEMAIQDTQTYRLYNPQYHLNQSFISDGVAILFESLNERISQNFLVNNPPKYAAVVEILESQNNMLIQNVFFKNTLPLKDGINEKIIKNSTSSLEKEMASELTLIKLLTSSSTEYETPNSFTHSTNSNLENYASSPNKYKQEDDW